MEELDQEKLQSSLTSTTRSLAGKMGLKAPEFSINVTADEPLQLTLTKKFLKLIIDVSIVSVCVCVLCQCVCVCVCMCLWV